MRRSCALTLLVVSLANGACYAWHAEPLAPDSLVRALQPMELRVTHANGSETILEQPTVRADTLVGVVQGGNNAQEVAIPISDVSQLATRKFSAGRTLGLVVGAAAITGVAIVAIFMINCPNTSACSN